MLVQRFQAYVMEFSAVAAAASASDTFQVDAKYDFWWMKATAFIYDSNGLGVSLLQLPNLEVLLSDGISQQQLSDAPVPIPSLFGTGELPFILPQPHRLESTATMNAVVTNNHASTAYSVQLVFAGFHVTKGATPSFAQRRMAGPARRRVAV